MKKIVLLSFLWMFVFQSCKKNTPLPDPIPINLSEKAKQIVSSDNRFGIELFKQLANPGYTDNNLMLSPLSVSQALSMTYNGAKNQTKTAFDNILHFNNLTLEQVNQSSKELTSALLSVDPKVALSIANSIWYKKGFTVENDFISRNQTWYDAEVKALDFGQSQSVTTINNWVDGKTNHKIDKIVDRLNPDDRMLLINAIYFKGEWRNRFNSSQTASKPFYLENGQQVSVQMMQVSGDYSYYENEFMDMLEMPYGTGNFSMVVLLPKEGYLVVNIIDSLNADTWETWQSGLVSVQDVPVSFPKFEFSYKESLKKSLMDLGLSDAFSAQADFTGINKDGGLLLSEVMHKTYIKVDEEGTEAAAVTAVTVGTTSVGPGQAFVADHPFVFIIKEKYTGAILFMGIVANPNLS